MISKIRINALDLDLDPEWANNESKSQEKLSYPLRLNRNPDTTPYDKDLLAKVFFVAY